MVRAFFLLGAIVLAWTHFGEYLDDERMVWAMILPAVYLVGMVMLRSD